MPAPNRQFFNRLGAYFVGVAIGCVLVGLLLQARAKMVKPAPNPAPPPSPTAPAPTPPAPNAP